MKRSRVARRLSAMVAVLGVVVATPAQASVGSRALVVATCRPAPTAAFAAAPDGQVRGFVQTGCQHDRISYVVQNLSRPGGPSVVTVTPYKGEVLASAQDQQGSYLLYRAGDGVRVTKVLRDGTMTATRLLSHAVGGGDEGSIAAAAGTWYAEWTEPSAKGGFVVRTASSPGFELAPTTTVAPARRGVDDSAPVIARIGQQKFGYLTAYAEHTDAGYSLELAHEKSRWTDARPLDTSTENPQPSVSRAGVYTYLAWVHDGSLRLATTLGSMTSGGTAYPLQVPLHQVPVPQPPAGTTVSHPLVGFDCGRLYVAYTTDTENSGSVWVDTLFQGRWVRHLVRSEVNAAPQLVGLAPHCSSGAVVWATPHGVYRSMVA